VRRMLAGATVTGGAVAVYALLVRSRCLRWGATGQESGGPLPGDDLIADPDLTATRAITVRVPASRVWPRIAQLGQGRGGFYSYDFLENLAGCDVHSADRIVPEWQDVMTGDEVRLAPQANLAVAYLERGRSVVLRGGIPTGEHRAPLRLHVGLRARRRASGDNAASRARKIRGRPLASRSRSAINGRCGCAARRRQQRPRERASPLKTVACHQDGTTFRGFLLRASSWQAA
jgi:hypothetical protein